MLPAVVAAGALVAASRELSGQRGGPYGNGLGRLPSVGEVARAAGVAIAPVSAVADLLREG
jgi:hypothetical protein